MTSRVSFSNLIREDIRRRTWSIVLASIVFLLAGPVMELLMLGDMGAIQALKVAAGAGVATAVHYREAYDYIVQIFKNTGMMYSIVTIVGALICAFQGFGYLYSRSKVDLYHSIPVKRGRLFAATYLNGILIYLVPYLASKGICLLLVFVQGGGFQKGLEPGQLNGLFVMLLSQIAVDFAGYLLLYNTAIVMVMLTGHIASGLLLTGIVFFFGPLVRMMMNLMAEYYFVTFVNVAEEAELAFLSPLVLYLFQLSGLYDGTFLGFMLIVLIAAAVFGVLALFLYQRKPSESAGRSIAFPVLETPLRIVVCIGSALTAGMFFLALSDNGMRGAVGWMLFGIVFGAAISHCLMQVLYRFDLRAALGHKLQALACIAAAVLILLIYRFDWMGYDNYLPAQGKVKEMAVAMLDVDAELRYYNYEDGDFRFYVSKSDYILNNMHVTDTDIPYALAKLCGEWTKENRNQFLKSYEWEEEIDGQRMTSIMVKYVLQSGKEARRYYKVPVDHVYEAMRQVYNTKEYKQASYSLMSVEAELVGGVSYEGSYANRAETVLGREEAADIKAAYEKDVLSMDMELIRTSKPIGKLGFLIGRNVQAAEEIARGRTNSNELSDYEVYPEFTNTLASLREAGIDQEVLQRKLEADKVESVELCIFGGEFYSKDATEAQRMRLTVDESTDTGRLQTLLDGLIPSEWYWNNRILTELDSNVEVTVVYQEGDEGQGSYRCQLKLGQIADYMDMFRTENE